MSGDSAALRFTPDRTTYIRGQTALAALAMAVAMAVLWLLDSPHAWTGAVAGLAAISLRGWYLASETLAEVWTVDGGVLTGPGGRQVALNQIEALNRLGSFVQVVTRDCDKHLIKYQADPAATIAALRQAQT